MSANLFGERLQMMSFGESHGPALGVVVDGCPAGVKFDLDLLKLELGRRRPGQTESVQQGVVSARNESDHPEILSGILETSTLGTPIAMIVRNQDQRSEDYQEILQAPRAGHADDVWLNKFGVSDHRGGGRSSGRETVSRVIAGSIAQMILRQLSPSTRVYAFASQIGSLTLKQQDILEIKKRFQSTTPPHPSHYFDQFVARFPSPLQSAAIEKLLRDAKEQGKSYGGIAQLWIENPPASLGQPVFHKLKADLTAAMMSVGAVSGVELGDGFLAVQAEGSEFHGQGPKNVGYGGIRGGISTGERIVLKVAFKPTSSVMDVAKKGRHDPCIVTRAIPVLESMANFVLADHALWQRTDRIDFK
jgi:chorismate synthase